jgi:tRNA(Ile)-lysidine synthase
LLHGLHGKLGKKRIFDSMLEHFLSFIRKHELVHPHQKLLLAVSGGIDSMVMLHLFHQCGFKPSVAHCNFQLRDKDAAADAAFVADVCKQLDLVCYVKLFDTKNYATEFGLSLQMAARELRYKWFNELMETKGYERIATAHHLNDNLETVLLNFTRGTGLVGLCGIRVMNGNIIRPLLFARRENIEAYAATEDVQWREDSSNKSVQYQRNFLRNNVIPKLAELNPDIENTFLQNLERLQATQHVFHEKLEQIKSAIVEKDKDRYIPKSIFNDTRTQVLFIWEIVKEAGFNWSQCRDIALAINNTGAIFYSDDFRLNVDRDYLILSKAEDPKSRVLIQAETSAITRGGENLLFEKVNRPDSLDNPASIALLDLDLIHFPLIWRSWQEGDRFIPLGMKGMKKVSDYLVDTKVSLTSKNRVGVLEDASGHIVWLVGMRIDERFKVNADSTNLLKIKLTRA